MNRVEKILNDLELAAKKLGMSIEDAVSILLGTHKTHAVTQTHVAVDEGNAASSAPSSATSTEGAQANPTNGGASSENGVELNSTVPKESAENPTSGGAADAGATAAGQEQSSTSASNATESATAETAAQNQEAAKAQIED